VIARLREGGERHFLRIDLGTAIDRYEVVWQVRHGRSSWQLVSRDLGVVLTSADDFVVWWRRALSVRDDLISDRPAAAASDRSEIFGAVKALLEAEPPGRYPLGHPIKMRMADNKCLQAKVAGDVGFSTPASVLTNSLPAAQRFYSEHSSVVAKPFYVRAVRYESEEIGLYASPVCGLDAERFVQGWLQQRIERGFDVRVNVLPRQTVAFKIETGRLNAAFTDWRPDTFDYEHAHIEVPGEIETRCREFLKRLNLKWGAFDFIVDRDGAWWFLECNPNGQWLWLEHKTAVPLSKFFARELLSAAPIADPEIRSHPVG